MTMTAIGFGVGVPLIGYEITLHQRHGWTFETSYFMFSQLNYWGSLFVSAAFIGCVMLAVRKLGRSRLIRPGVPSG